MNTINEKSIIFTKLSIQKDAEEYIIGSVINNVFIRVPEEAVILINYLDGNKNLKEITELLKQEHQLDVDVNGFVQDLLELDLIYSIDGKRMHNISHDKAQKKWLTNISKVIFNHYTNSIFLLLFLSCLGIFIVRPDLIPTYEDIFVYETVGVSLIIITATTWGLTFFHELGHYLATIKLGIPVKFNLSLRLYWLVVEADVSGLWSVPQKARYTPYLAGIAFDGLLLFLSLIIQIVFPSFFPGFFAMASLLLILTFGFHSLIFLRTDIYYVLMNYLNIPSIHDHAVEYIKSFMKSSSPSTIKMLSVKEQKYVKGYSTIYLIGSSIAIFLLVFYTIPGSLLLLKNTIDQLSSFQSSTFYFIDGAITLLIILVNMALWIIGAFSKYKHLAIKPFTNTRE
ncbi:hypothetical protein [Bacillus sp. SG-1]|uniref:hypothetical protein n=1 Tax=Bacillus sp. SG-1 TaxID=161544 RepID=UPI0001544FC1|nr:hypothetical protein [Bacillus sp. SG-1]EDL62875.1 hypothetical protein BSG1_18815 [Bacillus sp. SG-1]